MIGAGRNHSTGTPTRFALPLSRPDSEAAPPGAGDVAPDRASQCAAVRAKLHRSLRAWALLLDLEESLSTVTAAKAAYDRAIALKVSLVMCGIQAPLVS